MDTEPTTAAPALSGDQCGLSQCRRPLPARTGRGPRYEYCPDRTWDYDGKTLTCRELGDAEKKWTTVFGRAPADTVLTDLRAAVATAGEPLGQLAAVLERVRTEVGQHADAALTEAAQARAAAADAEGRAQSAAAETATAQRARQAAEEDQRAAEQRAREAEGVADRAQRAAAADREGAAVARGAAERLEEENERLRAAADTASGKANAAAARAERAEAQHQAAAEERDRLRAQLETERGEWTIERTRLTEQMNRLSTDYAVRLDELQQAHTDAQERTARDHAAQLADLQRQAGRAEVLAERIGDLEGQLRAEQDRDRDQEQASTEVRHGLEAMLRQLREEPHAPQENLVDLVVRALRFAQTPEVRKAAHALVDIDDRVVGVCNVAVDHHDGLIPDGHLPTSVLDRLERAGLTEEKELRRVTALAREALPVATAMAIRNNHPLT
ncbi:hypothetical protein [Nocardiopsis synnemataformans]|uniref:hypothetical protein n=1 Tax=Nocardiopsis synnemataformans TaxID=61305 RepID=UPI003EBA92C0